MESKYTKFLRFWLEEYIENKDVYELEEKISYNDIVLNINIKKEYMGKIIGKNGNIVTAIRNLLNTISKKDRKRIKIIVKEL